MTRPRTHTLPEAAAFAEGARLAAEAIAADLLARARQHDASAERAVHDSASADTYRDRAAECRAIAVRIAILAEVPEA